MAYSNATPPALPNYDVTAYPYRVMTFNYSIGEEDWYQIHLWYSSAPFTFDGAHVVNNAAAYTQICDSSGDWTEAMETDVNCKPGISGNVYQRIGTNHDIMDSAGNVWLAADTVTEVTEESVEPQTGVDSVSYQIGFGMGMSLLGRWIARICTW